MKTFVLTLALVSMLVCVTATTAGKDVPAPLTDRLGPFPTTEFPLPSDVRIEKGGILAVPALLGRGGPQIMRLGLSRDSHPQLINVKTLAEITRVNVRSIARLSDGSLMATATWTEGSISRSGFLFMDSDGQTKRKVGYGISLRSFLVTEHDFVVASIQEPSPMDSTDADAPSPYSAAVFDLEGQMLQRSIVASAGIDRTQSEQLRHHESRRVYPADGGYWISFPYVHQISLVKFRLENGKAIRDQKSKQIDRGKIADGVAVTRLRTPETLSEDSTIRMVNVIPRQKPGFVALWEYGRPASGPPTAYGSFAVTVHASDGSVERFIEIPGIVMHLVHDGEDGRLVRFDPIARSWTLEALNL